MDPVDEHCVALESPSYTNFILSLLILIGILISYLPQHIRIIRRRSSFGLSPWFVLLGTTSGTCQFANIIVLPTSRADVACCKDIDGFSCFAGLLGIGQVAVQWSCFAAILFLFFIFFPRATPGDFLDSPSKPPSFRVALIVMGTCIVHAIVTLVLSFYFIVAHATALQSWANFLGILSTVLASIQYFPQIYTTFTLKRVGSLSIPMMCIQTPGSFVWAGSLAARLGKEGWSAWGVYVVTGCLQGTLLVMGIIFELREQRRQKESGENGSVNGEVTGDGPDGAMGGQRESPDERTPLIDPSRSMDGPQVKVGGPF